MSGISELLIELGWSFMALRPAVGPCCASFFLLLLEDETMALFVTPYAPAKAVIYENAD